MTSLSPFGLGLGRQIEYIQYKCLCPFSQKKLTSLHMPGVHWDRLQTRISFLNAKTQDKTLDTKMNVYRQLEEILKSFCHVQEPNAQCDTSIQLGKASKCVDLYVRLQFIIGDAEGEGITCAAARHIVERPVYTFVAPVTYQLPGRI
jgi:hypothetical protein